MSNIPENVSARQWAIDHILGGLSHEIHEFCLPKEVDEAYQKYRESLKEIGITDEEIGDWGNES